MNSGSPFFAEICRTVSSVRPGGETFLLDIRDEAGFVFPVDEMFELSAGFGHAFLGARHRRVGIS